MITVKADLKIADCPAMIGRVIIQDDAIIAGVMSTDGVLLADVMIEYSGEIRVLVWDEDDVGDHPTIERTLVK